MSLDGLAPINSPYTITYYLGRFLRERAREQGWDFQYVNLDDTTPCDIGADDIVIGHLWHPEGFMTQALHSAAKYKFVLQPYQRDIVGVNEAGWIKELMSHADHFFAITGSYWYDTMEQGLYGEWKAKTTRVDMAVDGNGHHYYKRQWNKKGKRGFLCIGADIHYKGLDLVAELAQTAGVRLGYCGNAQRERFQHVPQMQHIGGVSFTPQLVQYLCDEYDFFISLARGDANPTTLLETACWGLVGLCNNESGYHANDPFLELRLNDMAFNWEQLERCQNLDEDELQSRSLKMRQLMQTNYTWTRFTTTVWNGMTKVVSLPGLTTQTTETLPLSSLPDGTSPRSELKLRPASQEPLSQRQDILSAAS